MAFFSIASIKRSKLLGKIQNRKKLSLVLPLFPASWSPPTHRRNALYSVIVREGPNPAGIRCGGNVLKARGPLKVLLAVPFRFITDEREKKNYANSDNNEPRWIKTERARKIEQRNV